MTRKAGYTTTGTGITTRGGAVPESGPGGVGGGLKTYAYVNNPLTWVDPLGLAGCKLLNGQAVADFEKSLVKLPVNERVPIVKDMSESVANHNGWTRAKNIESKNRGRTIYQDDK